MSEFLRKSEVERNAVLERETQAHTALNIEIATDLARADFVSSMNATDLPLIVDPEKF